MAEEYLRFLNLLKALDGPLTTKLDSASLKLLETISIEAVLNKNHFTVNELLSMKALGSQASIHKKLHALVDGGYVTLEVQEDARIKKVVPTKETKKLFSQVNKLFISVSKNAN
jgi:DNA-binding MarR family transcriptional regulator